MPDLRSTYPTRAVCRLLAAAVSLGVLVAAPGPARAELGQRMVVEADLRLTFAEHLGRVPLVGIGGAMELGVGRSIGLFVGGFAQIASDRALPFFQETGVGGGIDLGLRFHIRGNWPRGFGIGLAASLAVTGGVSLLNPRVEIAYRFLLLDHLTIRIYAAGGGMFLWDTEPGDDRPGPAAREGYVSDSLSGASIGVGLTIGWSTAQPLPRRPEEIDD